jgi:hypothetical protein
MLLLVSVLQLIKIRFTYKNYVYDLPGRIDTADITQRIFFRN